MWYVDVPDPHDLDAAWINIATFETKAEAIAHAKHYFGADEEGRIGTISKVSGEGYLVDLPNPHDPEGPWIFIDSFERKKEAVDFMKTLGGDRKGDLPVVSHADDEEAKSRKRWDPGLDEDEGTIFEEGSP